MRVTLTLIFAFGVAACGGDGGKGSGAASSAGPTGGGAAAGTGGAGEGGGATGGQGPSCPSPEPPHMGEKVKMGTVTAKVIDQDGEAVEGVPSTICGTNVCSDVHYSDAAGSLGIDASSVDIDFDDPRFNTGFFGMEHTKMSAFIPTKPGYDFGVVRVFSLPPFDEGVPLVAGQEATQSGVTLGLLAGAVVDFDTLTFTEPEQQVLRAAVVDLTVFPAAELPAVDPALGLEVLLALAPMGTHLCPGAALRFDNVRGWTAGAEVEIFVHGTKQFDHYAPFGGWSKLADGAVSADGKTVATADGQGIELLGTLAAALKK